MIFDITTQENAMRFICEFLGTTTDVVNDFLKANTICDWCIDTTNVTADNLAEYLCIDFNNLNATDIEAVGLHYTSNDDECNSIKMLGLGDLQFAVNHETPLKIFLSDNGITFNTQLMEMYSDGETFNIEYTTYQTDKPLTHIARKMYFDNQISCFFRVKDVTQYGGRVDRRPEFLFNLDNQFKKMNLSHQWVKKSQSYEIKFQLPVNSFTGYTFYEDKDNHNSNNYRLAKSLVDLALSVVSLADRDEVFAYLKPTVVIGPQQILSIIKL